MKEAGFPASFSFEAGGMKVSPVSESQVEHGPLVVSHAMPEVQTVSLGFFVDMGSRDEGQDKAGIAHALEHMLFKGTGKHDVNALSQMLDRLGGSANAFTSRERTCFHMHVLYEDWPKALDILAEMLLDAAIPNDEWLREREVIFAEIAMVEDTPEEWVMDQHVQALFPGQGLGRLTLGTRQSLLALTQQDMADYLAGFYRPPHLLICGAGRLGHEALVERVSAMHWPQGLPAAKRQPAKVADGLQLLPRQTGQAQMVLSYPGIAAASDERPVAWLANQILGGSMSSRLFREVREKLGLAYHIGSHLSSLSDTGTWTITGGTDPQRLPECIKVIRTSVRDIVEQGVEPEEFSLAQNLLEVQLRMGMDSVEGNMLRLSARFDEPEVKPQTYWLERIRQVKHDTLQHWLAERLSASPLLTVCGPEAQLSGFTL